MSQRYTQLSLSDALAELTTDVSLLSDTLQEHERSLYELTIVTARNARSIAALKR